MSKCVRIHGDMNIWTLAVDLDSAQLADPAQPQELSVAKPLTGTLLLSVRGVAGVALLPNGTVDPMGWIPGDVPIPHLYLPSATISAAAQNLYQLAENVDPVALQSQIIGAMTPGPEGAAPVNANVNVNVTVDGQGSSVVLNCATLPFVVITRPTSR
jgi:hypothetical protein